MATEVTIKTNKQTAIQNKLSTVIRASITAMNALSSKELRDLGATKEHINAVIAMKQWADNCHLIITQDKTL